MIHSGSFVNGWWLDEKFATGCPNDDEWEGIIQEDDQYDYSTAQSYVPSEPQDEGSGGPMEDYNLPHDGDLGDDNDRLPYNPAMHTF